MVKRDQQGFLVDANTWTVALAGRLAKELDIVLTDEHWVVVRAVRQFREDFDKLPTMRLLVKYLQAKNGAGWSSATLHLLFHEPLKESCKIAGLPKPPHCL
jgi:TusE/DsrC/DsvC family sulfur relay protein